MDTSLAAKTFSGSTERAEQNWLHAAKNGERWALEQLYSSYSKQIYALCFRMLGRADDAEDAMQAAFVHAFKELHRFRGDCMAKTWLYRIAANESVNSLRRRSRSAASLADESAPMAADGSRAIQRRIAVQASLDQLRQDQRLILILRYWEDLSYDEIAAVLEVSMPCVKMRLSRARAEFRRLYGEEP